jgi:hypothetical protein
MPRPRDMCDPRSHSYHVNAAPLTHYTIRLRMETLAAVITPTTVVVLDGAGFP